MKGLGTTGSTIRWWRGSKRRACEVTRSHYGLPMSFAEVLDQLPAFTLAQRQMLVRHALELDDPGLSAADERAGEKRLGAHRADPASALSLDELKTRLRSRFQA